MKSNYFHVPELDIDDKQRNHLVNKFLELTKQNGGEEQFTREDGTASPSYNYCPSGTSVIEDIFQEKKINDLKKICKSIPGNKETDEPFDFLHSQGSVVKHKDKLRSVFITIPLQLNEKRVLKFWNDEGTEMIDQLKYDYKTYIVNAHTQHSVETSERSLFWQGSIFEEFYNFDQIKEMYENEKLFKI